MTNRWYIGFAASLLAAVLAYALWSAGSLVLPWLAEEEEEGLKSARVRATWTLDLETGEQGTPQADLHWGMQGPDLPYLAAHRAALIAEPRGARWEELDAAALAKLVYAPNRYSAWGPDAPVRKGAVFGVRTAEGNFAKIRVKQIRNNYALQVDWVLYVTRGAGKTVEAKAKPEPEPEPKPQPIKPAPPPNPALAWLPQRDAALAAYRAQRYDEAFRACGKAVEAAAPAGGAHHALALVTCGSLLALQRDYPQEVEAWLKQAKTILAGLEQGAIVAALGPRESLLQERCLRMLGVLYRDRNRTGEAAEHFALAVDTVRAMPAPETGAQRLALRADLYDLGVALAQLGYRGTARRALAESRELYLRTEPDHPTLKAIDERLARLGQ